MMWKTAKPPLISLSEQVFTEWETGRRTVSEHIVKRQRVRVEVGNKIQFFNYSEIRNLSAIEGGFDAVITYN